MRNAVSVYLERLRKGRVYSPLSYLLGASLRGRFTEAGAVAWLRGPPVPHIDAGQGAIEVGDVGIYPGVSMICSRGGRISVGDNTYINRNTYLFAEEEITVGEECMISWDVIITDTDGYGELGNPGGARPVQIGKKVWIGSKAVILGGAVIGDGAVIAGGSVVKGEVEAGEIVASRPAKEIYRIDPPAGGSTRRARGARGAHRGRDRS